MADLERVRVWADALIRLHLDPGEWSFDFDHARTRAGLCDFGKKRISVSKHLAAKYEDDEIHQVLLHEVAHALAGRGLDFVMLDPRFALAETMTPASLAGQALGEARIRSRCEVTVVCVKSPGGEYTPANADTVINAGDELLVVGEVDKVDAFTRMG